MLPVIWSRWTSQRYSTSLAGHGRSHGDGLGVGALGDVDADVACGDVPDVQVVLDAVVAVVGGNGQLLRDGGVEAGGVEAGVLADDGDLATRRGGLALAGGTGVGSVLAARGGQEHDPGKRADSLWQAVHGSASQLGGR